MTQLTSRSGVREFGAGHPTLLINDQLRIIDQDARVLAELKQGSIRPLLDLAHQGMKIGIDTVDILVDHPDLDEVELLPKIAAGVHDEMGCFISLDSRNPAALKAALQVLRPYKALINSVNAEPEVLDKLLPLAVDFGAAVVGIPIGPPHGVPHTVEGRLAQARIILEAARAYGIPQEDMVIDAICLATAAMADSMRVTLETLAALVSDLRVTTLLGIGNAGHGMPAPMTIDLAYLLAAVPWGLHGALVNPSTPGLIEASLAIDFLSNRDPAGRRYIRSYRQKVKERQAG
jgi:5-methyltetrahydrofolate--homocysteine methyltransferase